MRVKILYIVTFVFMTNLVYGQSWLSPWKNRQAFGVTNFNYVPMTDFQTRLEISHRADMQPDFDDLRFVNEDGDFLSHWVEYVDTSTSAVVWIKTDIIMPFAGKTYHMYYGNDTAMSISDPVETFVFYDDFESDDGWNVIGDQVCTSVGMLDSMTSTLYKFDKCGSKGAWKSIGTTMKNFKLITREFMPLMNSGECTVMEYGIESEDYTGINLRRDANDTGENTEFGLEIRNGDDVSGVATTLVDQPVGKWYRTAISFSQYCHFNIQSMIFTDDMQMIGNIYGETFDAFSFDRFTIRGGHEYHMDYIAVAKHMCVWPVVSWQNTEICPQVLIVNFVNDYCEEGVGEISVEVSGGKTPYWLSWYEGQDLLGTMSIDSPGVMTIDSLVPGNYCLKLKDAQGCEN